MIQSGIEGPAGPCGDGRASHVVRMEWLMILAGVWFVLFAWFVRECRRAPLGYQDEGRFHEVQREGLEADLQRTRERWANERNERDARRHTHRGAPAS